MMSEMIIQVFGVINVTYLSEMDYYWCSRVMRGTMKSLG